MFTRSKDKEKHFIHKHGQTIILGSYTSIVHTITFNAVDMPLGLPSTFQRLGIQLGAGSHSSPQDPGFRHQ